MKRTVSYLLVFVLGFVVCAWTLNKFYGLPVGRFQVSSNPPPGGLKIVNPGDKNQVREAAKVVRDYVVNIDMVGRRQPDLWPFFDLEEEPPTGTGSGVIMSPDGYIITNSHVVEDAAKLTVTTHDGKKYPAQVIGRDSRSDIAVIKIKASGLHCARFAGYSVQPGDWVIAVGSPLGLESTVTVGVVSATKRGPIRIHDKVLTDVIQTDAAINPGNSGGALADLNGDLVGINTLIYSPSGGSIGIGFAIPSSIVKRVAQELIKHGKVSHPYIGITYQPYNSEVREFLEMQGLEGLPKVEGVRIVEVIPDSPAARAGLEPFDIIIKINGKQVSGTNSKEGNKVSLADEVAGSKIGSRLLLDVWHAATGSITTVGVVVGEMPREVRR